MQSRPKRPPADAPTHRSARGQTLAWLAALALAGCDVGPAYHRPNFAVPPAWSEAPPNAEAVRPDWWRSFGAPELDALITAALAASPDIEAAAARVVEADQAVRIAGSPLLPSLNATAAQSWQRTGLGRNTTSFRLPGTTSSGSASHYIESRSYSGEFQAAYEVDLWGRNRDAWKAAEASADAARYDYETVRLTTIASVASTYFQALDLRDRLAIARRNLADQEQVLAAFRGRLAVGTASLLDVSQQEALTAGTRATLPALQSQYEQQVIALAVLVGRPPERIALAPPSLASLTLAPIGAGLPAAILRRRPDIASAEAALVAQNYTVKQDFAAFFPSLQLTAAGGVSSTALSLLTGPGSLLASLASSLTQTIFDNGLKSGTLGQARGRYRELAADWSRAVIAALSDVETALAQQKFAAEQEGLEAEAVRTARRAADIAHAQMRVGTVDIITVLNTEATLFSDEDALAQVRLARFLAHVALYRALGGGWTLPSSGTTPS